MHPTKGCHSPAIHNKSKQTLFVNKPKLIMLKMLFKKPANTKLNLGVHCYMYSMYKEGIRKLLYVHVHVQSTSVRTQLSGTLLLDWVLWATKSVVCEWEHLLKGNLFKYITFENAQFLCNFTTNHDPLAAIQQLPNKQNGGLDVPLVVLQG